MDYDALIGLLSGFLPIAAAIVAITQWQNSQLNRLANRIDSVNHTHALEIAKIDGRLDNFELRINGNRELIEHRTDRFQEADAQLHEHIDRQIARLEGGQEQIKGYLERHGFNRREG